MTREGKDMRLDKYLKVSRLIERRTVANDAFSAGREVKPGDIIEIGFGTKSVKVEVLAVKDTVRKDEAAEMFRYL